LDYEWDLDGAEREFRRALQLNPGSAWVRHWIAHSLEARGRLEEALKEMRAALALDPLSIPVNWDVGTELVSLKRYDEASAHLQKAAELFPNVPVISFLQAQCYYRQGKMEAAHRIVENVRTNSPEVMQDPFLISFLAIADAREGRPAEARAALYRLEGLRRTQYVDAFLVLELCSVLKDQKQLDIWLRRMREERSPLYIYAPILKEFYAGELTAKALVGRENSTK